MSDRNKSLRARLRRIASGVRKRTFYTLWEPGYLPVGHHPAIMAPSAMVTSFNQLSAMAGVRVLSIGGNAVDAAVAVGLADTVVNPNLHTIGGEATILIYLVKERRVVVINGSTRAPRKATIQFYREKGIKAIPGDGLLAAGVPAMVDAWITALDRFGTLSLSQVAQPAIELAERGYPLSPSLHDAVLRRRKRFLSSWRTSGEVFLQQREVPRVGALMVNRDLAGTLRSLVSAERSALERGEGRSEALNAARHLFYRGDLAEAIVRFSEASGGLLSREDLEEFSVTVEDTVSVDYRGYQVHKAGPWCQGPVLLQALNLLEGFDLGSMSPSDYRLIHTIVEAEKLAFADRERYYGDPQFVDVPVERLLSKEYAEVRRKLIAPGRASMELRPGDPYRMEASLAKGWAGSMPAEVDAVAGGATQGDTIHFDVVDPAGNMVSATSSGGDILNSPLVEGLGFALGTRLQMFYLDPQHADALSPGKRPRTTVSPTLVLRDGHPFVSLGSPGGDAQEQATLQALIRLIDFHMPIQQALESPIVLTRHFPSSFHPHSATPGSLLIEGRIPLGTEWQLRRRGHRVSVRSWLAVGSLAIQEDPDSGVRIAGVDPRPAIMSELEACGIGF